MYPDDLDGKGDGCATEAVLFLLIVLLLLALTFIVLIFSTP